MKTHEPQYIRCFLCCSSSAHITVLGFDKPITLGSFRSFKHQQIPVRIIIMEDTRPNRCTNNETCQVANGADNCPQVLSVQLPPLDTVYDRADEKVQRKTRRINIERKKRRQLEVLYKNLYPPQQTCTVTFVPGVDSPGLNSNLLTRKPTF